MFSNQALVIKRYRQILIAIAVLVVLGLAWRDIAPRGHLSINHTFGKRSAFVSELVPVDRTQTHRDGMAVVAEPVYMTVRYPRPFKTLEAELLFSNPANAFIELGPQAAAGEVFARQGVNHPQLNTLMEAPGWERAAILLPDGPTLWQSRASDYLYSSAEQFFEQLPDAERTAYYGLDWLKPYLPDFERVQQAETQSIPVALQGSHEFYVATNRDRVAMNFEVTDLNRVLGADEVLVQIRDWNGTVLAEERLEDDGNTTDDGRFSSKRSLELAFTGLAEASVVSVRVVTTEDMVLQGLRFDAPYLVAKGRVKVAGGPAIEAALGTSATPTVYLTTNARALNFHTDHMDTLQTVHVGLESVVIDEPFTNIAYTLAATRRFLLSQGYTLTLEKGNLDVQGRGVFAFNSTAYFSPTPWVFDESIDAETHEISYVIANYTPPQRQKDGVYTQKIGMDLSEVYAPDQHLRLQLTAQGLSAESPLVLQRLRLSFASEPITFSNFSEKLKRFIEREF